MSDPYYQRLQRRHLVSKIFTGICLIATWFGLVTLAVLMTALVLKATGTWDPTSTGEAKATQNWLTPTLLTNQASSQPEKAGMLASIWGTVWLIVMTAILSIPVGIGAAIYLEEYARENRLTRFIRLNISNLAGIPSIVFGILGLTAFSRMFGLFSEPTVIGIPMGIGMLKIPLPFGKSLISGSLTITLLILPIIIIAAQEALRSVPQSIRHAALALGATKWQTIWSQVLPASLPGIMTGVILSLSRAIGETAPIIVVGAVSFITFNPGYMESVSDLVTDPEVLMQVPASPYTVMPLQIYIWVLNSPDPEFKNVASAAIVVLLTVLLLMNALAVYIRNHFSKRLDW
ncbi:phosphate ABC transporter permease PstA [Rubinisphaera italica]|uniref:Phosphate transport system permease protein PstA n=1 Tax=Rubinisphaera italica TaxID=2527969 RepID=A0A5C5XHL7_9PLAN|nr:phosphate ABC transporter permease PstA [Rubinisphaera italica]TWT62666.1 Phosphate transport system permease protein PstA [Rubinisphaera italica]